MKNLISLKLNLGDEFSGLGPLGIIPKTQTAAVDMFNQVLSNLIGFLTVIAGLWFIFQFILGAIAWLSAGGDQNKVKAAQEKITQAVIGLVVVVAAIFLIDFIGLLLGLEILSPGNFILGFWDKEV